MPENIHVINNFISEYDCSRVINFINEMKNSGLLEKRGDFKQRLMRFNVEGIMDLVKHYGLNATETHEKLSNPGFNLALSDYGIFISEPGYSMNHHIDTINSNGLFKHLKYSTVLYLNDGFGGGDIEFPNVGFSYSPKRGDAILFPADDLKYLHGVSEIKSGLRYTMSFWHSETGTSDVYFGGRKE